MLHQKILVSFLDGFRKQRALDITAVDEVILIISVSSGNHRFPDISAHPKVFSGVIHLKQGSGNLPSEYVINQILFVAVPGGVQFGLIIIDEFKGDIRV